MEELHNEEIPVPLHIQVLQKQAKIDELSSVLAQFISKSRGNKNLKELARIGRKALLPQSGGNLPELADF